MTRTWRRPAFAGFWCLLLLIAGLAAPAAGAEFSALMMVKDDAKLMPGKISVRGDMMRQEFVDESGQTITIVRPDKKVIWVILARERTYMEMPLKKKLPGQFIQIPPLATGKRLVGKERLNGYDTEKYEVSVPAGGGREQQTYWMAEKLGLPIKMECRQRRFSMEYRSIREEKVPDRLFDVPPGYQKATSPGAFADKMDP
jgi:hypothetical protein